jgi:hypothetical protein
LTLLTGENAFEVNPLDLIAVECLRIFEPEVYKSISLSKTLLTSSYNDQNEREKAIADLEGIFKNAPQERIEDVKTIIKQLFPPIESLFGGYSYGDDYGDIWFKDLRICHPDIFSRYFQFSIPIDDISQSDLEDILFLSNNRDALVQKLNSLKSNNLLKAALNQLDAYKHDIPLENSNDFIPALMDIGDTTDDQSIGFTSFSSHLHLVRIVLWYLRKEDSIEERGNKLLTAFSKTDGLSVMAHILAGEISRREKPDNGNLLLTTDATLEKAKGDFIKKFKSIIKSDPKLLFSNIHLAGLLFRTKNFGEIKTIRKWLGENITTFEDLLVILDRFMSQVSSQTMGDYVGKIKDQIRLDNLNTFFPLENVIELIKNKDRESLNEHQKRVWDALQATLKRKEKGLSDDSWDDY